MTTDLQIEARYNELRSDPTYGEQKLFIDDMEEIWKPAIDRLQSIPVEVQKVAVKLHDSIECNINDLALWNGEKFSETPWTCGIRHVYFEPTTSVEDPRLTYVLLAYRLLKCKNAGEVAQAISESELYLPYDFFWDILDPVFYERDSKQINEYREEVKLIVQKTWPSK